MIDYLNPKFDNIPGRRPKHAMYDAAWSPDCGVDVSIVTPYYNTEEFFLETHRSIIAQSLQNWEWVIVDDGSTDVGSIHRLTLVAEGDQRIKVLRQQNAGPSAARNKGVDNSRGRYVCLLDSDDMIEPTYIEKCVWFLESNPEFAFCNSFSVVFGDQEYLWTQGFERNKDFLKANSGPPISVVRRDAYVAIGGFDESIRFGHEDWDFWLAMARAGNWGYTLPEYLQWYRKRGTGRFEQIMRTGKTNEQFEFAMRRKYFALKEQFPSPRRRTLQPYETIPVEWLVSNRLQPNPNGHRIMFILPWMVIGGADRVNLDLIEGLIAKGHQVTVCATLSAHHKWEHKFAELTPDIFVLPNFLHPTDYPRFLAYLIDSRKIDTVVITHSTMGYYLLPYLQASTPSAAFIDLSHVEEPHWLNGGHPRFGVGYQDALDLNVVTTSHLARWMERHGADSARIRVLYTGVRPPSAERSAANRNVVRARFGVEQDMPLVVFAGRLCEQKRPDFLADVLKGASEAGLRFRALIIGDGPLRPSFETRLDKYGLRGNIQTIGSRSHDEWLDILIGADILLMPSEYEGISIALLEAMAAGVVPVVARVGGQEEIISEDTGYLISPGDGELLRYVDAIEDLTSNPGKLCSKSNACQALMASKYSWGATIENFECIISDAHQRINGRRCQFTLSVARELVSLALENKRLSDGWSELVSPSLDNKRSSSDGRATLHRVGSGDRAVARFVMTKITNAVVFLNKSKLGRRVLQNQAVRRVGRGAIARLNK